MTGPIRILPMVAVGGLIVAAGLFFVARQSPPADEPSPTNPPAAEVADEAAESIVSDEPAVPEPHTIDAPLNLVPADYLLCWKGLPFPGAEKKSDQPSSLRTLLDLAGRVFGDRLDETQKLSLRILETLGIVGGYPFTVTVLDATAKPAGADGSSAKLDQLRIAAVIQTGSLSGSEPFLRVIQKAINELTDAGAAQLTTQRAGRWQYQSLVDERLPEWCEIAWGQIEKHFVIAFGRNVWPEIAGVASGEKASISRVGWIASVRRMQEDEPLIEVLVSSRKIRERLDPFVSGRATDFFRAWHIEDVEYMHWALGFRGRALYCVAHYREENLTKRILYADPNVRDERYLRTIPEEARYAIYRISSQRFLSKLVASYYATRDPEEREAAATVWRKIQDDLGIDVERDALNRLGRTIVAHNYPTHPFNLPLAFTSLIEIGSEPAKVRQTLERMLEAWQAALDRHADETGRELPLRLIRDKDGVWHVEFMYVHGVAWTFTDQFIVTSWSPIALRDYLTKVGDRIGKRE